MAGQVTSVSISHEEAAAATAAAAAARTGETTPTTPTFTMPEKFAGKSAEDIAKAYVELEKLRGTTAPATATDKKPVVTATSATEIPEAPATTTTEQTTEQQKAIETKITPEQYTQFEQEYLQNDGKLSDESMTALKSKGFTQEFITSHIEGRIAQAQLQANEIFEAVGGQDKYKQLMQFASDSLTPAQRTAYNKAMQSGDMASIQLAVEGLHARFTREYGSNPNRIVGKTTTNTSTGYASTAEMTADMANPKYKIDPAFRAEVDRKLAATTAF
jgi:hypothetical protein